MRTPSLERRRPRLRPAIEVSKLEDRTLLSTMGGDVSAAAIPQGTDAYVTQLYYDLLNRAPDAEGFAVATSVASQGPRGRDRVVNAILNSTEYRTSLIDGYYENLLGRMPSQQEVDGWLNVLNQGPSYEDVRLAFLRSDEFYAHAGGTNDSFVRALYSDILSRGPDTQALQGWVSALDSGTSREDVAARVLFSPEADQLFVTRQYNALLGRAPEAGGLQYFVNGLNQGAGYRGVIGTIVTEPEYVNRASTTTSNIVETAQGAGNFSILVQALQATGLDSVLQGDGPFTVFAPTDAAFNALPAGTLQNLLNNPDQLRQILLYHVHSGLLTAPQVAGAGLISTVNGTDVGVTVGDHGVMVDGANVVSPNIFATNGIIHAIDTVMLPPTNNIVQTALNTPQFSTLVTALQAANLVDTLNGDGPFTVFAPTNDAFNALPPDLLQNLLNNPDQLRQILLYHVTPGMLSTTELATAGRVPTVQGGSIDINRFQGNLYANTSEITNSNVVTTNGVIQVVDRVLIPPTT